MSLFSLLMSRLRYQNIRRTLTFVILISPHVLRNDLKTESVKLLLE